MLAGLLGWDNFARALQITDSGRAAVAMLATTFGFDRRQGRPWFFDYHGEILTPTCRPKRVGRGQHHERCSCNCNPLKNSSCHFSTSLFLNQTAW
jgi:hypothetical protein